MELQQVIEKRRSVRSYQDRPVSQGLIEKIVSLAREAPSAGNLHAYRVIVTDQQLTPYPSPVCLVVCAEPEKSGARYGERGRSLYAVQDATIFAAYAQLIAVDLGLASVWVGAFRENKVKRALGLEDGLRPIAIIQIGYADD